ncbi:hypothetical protein BJV82DRAFT_602921 [Fennellomyces sp. T-0311]|nr:hypothetical protein BJV82DRAFT_602921 [Fennellomyces sp. T-0311]
MLRHENTPNFLNVHYSCCALFFTLYNCVMADRQQQRRGGGSGNNSGAAPDAMRQTGRQQPQQADPQLVDEVLALITSVEDQDVDQMKALAAKLLQFPEPQFQSNTTQNLDPLAVLDPSQHSLGFLFFLTSRCLAVNDADQAIFFVHTVNHFVNAFDPDQLLYAPARITHIGNALEHLAKVLRNPLVPIIPLSVAIERLSPQLDTLTSLHVPFVKACLLAKTYRPALSILDVDIENVDPNVHDISIKTFLLYHYYSAMVYIGNKKFARAIEFLILAISAPAQVISAIQVEAYKKFILVSLIHHGRIPPLPRYTSVMLEKYFKSKYPVYTEIAEAFSEGLPKLRAAIDTHQDALREDSHMGLAKQCVEALHRETIKRLGDIYVTLTLGEMAALLAQKESRNVSEQELERMLLAMIEKDQIRASISCVVVEPGRSVKMVHFADEEDAGLAVNLEMRIQDATDLRKKVSAMDKAEGLSKEFQQKYMMISSQGEAFPVQMAYEEDMDLPLDDESKFS